MTGTTWQFLGLGYAAWATVEATYLSLLSAAYWKDQREGRRSLANQIRAILHFTVASYVIWVVFT